MTIGFLGALVFALVFFAIWSLREVALSTGQTRTIHAMIAVVFIVLAWVIGRIG